MFVAKPPATLPHRISGRGETQTRLAKLGARHSSPLPSLPGWWPPRAAASDRHRHRHRHSHLSSAPPLPRVCCLRGTYTRSLREPRSTSRHRNGTSYRRFSRTFWSRFGTRKRVRGFAFGGLRKLGFGVGEEDGSSGELRVGSATLWRARLRLILKSKIGQFGSIGGEGK